MNIAIIETRTDAEGILSVEIPLGSARANHAFRVIVEDQVPSSTPQEWSQWVESMAGSISDPTLIRPTQPPLDTRDS